MSKREVVEYVGRRILVGDTDDGMRMKARFDDIKELIKAYQSGEIAERDQREF